MTVVIHFSYPERRGRPMANVIAFRPKMGIEVVRDMAKKLHYPNMSRFIEDAILEKAQRHLQLKADPKAQTFSTEVNQALLKYLGIRLVDPKSKLGRDMHQKSEDMRRGKVKSYRWKGSLQQLFDDAKHHRYAKPEDR